MRSRLLSCVLALLALAWTAPCHALLAVFTDGRVLKVADARLDGATLVLTLDGGGVLQIPAVRIDRVVSDEVETRPADSLPDTVACDWQWRPEPLPEATPYRQEVEAAAEAADLHPWLVAAVVETESRWDPGAVSRAGAAGLMQLMPSAAADHAVKDPFDPAENLRGGTQHLRRMLDRFDDLRLALAAYNAGAATVERYADIPPYRETRAYIRRVLAQFCPAAGG
jgi:hypothetical protein